MGFRAEGLGFSARESATLPLRPCKRLCEFVSSSGLLLRNLI